MTPRITWRLIRNDLRLGPRSPVFLMAIGMPVLITFLLAGVFGSLFEPVPRLAIVDQGESKVSAMIGDLTDLEVTRLEDVDRLIAMVEADDFDAGLVLPSGFETSGAEVEFYVSGSSLASTRAILTAVVTEAVGDAVGVEPAVSVTVTRVGDEEGVPIGDRLVPMMVFYALVIAGMFLPSASLVEERQTRTVEAVLVTPARIGDVLLAKGTIAVVVSTVMSMLTLALNNALGGQALLLAAILLIGSVMLAEFGLMLGMWARDANTLFTAVKAGGIVIFLPVIFIIWPGLPQWIPQWVPTYYFIDPVYRVAILGKTASDVWLTLLGAVAICVVLAPAVLAYAKRAEQRLALSV